VRIADLGEWAAPPLMDLRCSSSFGVENRVARVRFALALIAKRAVNRVSGAKNEAFAVCERVCFVRQHCSSGFVMICVASIIKRSPYFTLTRQMFRTSGDFASSAAV